MKGRGPRAVTKEDGFSLIEVLLAMAIVAGAILAIMGMFPFSYRQVTKAGRVSTMTHLGQMKIDQLRILTYSQTTTDPDLTAGTHYYSGGSDPSVPNYSKYSVMWTVTDDVPVTDMKQIVVEVGYNYRKSNGALTNDPTGIVNRLTAMISRT